MALQALPIDAVLPALVQALRGAPCALLKAPTGAGKTTRVPPALLDAGLAGAGQVVVLEPRRLAARAAARRMAFERGCELGGEVGYHVRFDRRAGARTRILVVTDGLLVRMLQEDPYLERVGAVIFDELHERSLDTDLALAMTRKLQLEARPELKLVAMSATLVPGELSRWLGNAPLLESEGRLHPVRCEFLERPDEGPLHVAVRAAVARALETTPGDVLVFLPGIGEIRRARAELEDLARRRGLALHELYGDLPPDQQDAVLLRGPRRKVVLATNVAQTSVTLEGITAVVDSGLARTLRYDPGVGLDRLELGPISRSSAEQRAGRAGRTEPGVCLRLWTEAEQRSRPQEDEPEIRRVDLAPAVLQLAAWGEPDPARFDWLEPPPPASLQRALALLEDLGALEGRRLTPRGAALAQVPAHPRIARFLLEGRRLGAGERAATAAALLAERDPFFRSRGRRLASVPSESDLLDRVQALESFEDRGHTSFAIGELNPGAARAVLQVQAQLARISTGAPRDAAAAAREGGEPGVSSAEALARAALAAYPDRLARRREPGSRRGVLASGRGVTLAEESAVLDPELFVCLELDAGRRGERAEALVRMASGVQRAWLDLSRARTAIECVFDAERDRVTALRRTRLGELVLDEVQVPAPPEEAARLLAEAAAADLPRALTLAGGELATFLARARSLRQWMPELELPAFDEDDLRALLPELCQGRASFAELASAPVLAHLQARLTSRQRAALEREAPERLEVPSGSRVALQYEPGRPPVLAVRVQELFGLSSTPRIAAGRVAVLLHLLAPNGRPQQVTDDLAGFWERTYPLVRKELRARYPRHAWPEDPARAAPERRPRRRPT